MGWEPLFCSIAVYGHARPPSAGRNGCLLLVPAAYSVPLADKLTMLFCLSAVVLLGIITKKDVLRHLKHLEDEDLEPAPFN